jgi:hypothetical protein
LPVPLRLIEFSQPIKRQWYDLFRSCEPSETQSFS